MITGTTNEFNHMIAKQVVPVADRPSNQMMDTKPNLVEKSICYTQSNVSLLASEEKRQFS